MNKEEIIAVLHTLPDEKVDKFLNYLKNLVSTDTAHTNQIRNEEKKQ